MLPLFAIIEWFEQRGTMCTKNTWHCLVSAKMQGISENKQKIDTVSTGTRRILYSFVSLIRPIYTYLKSIINELNPVNDLHKYTIYCIPRYYIMIIPFFK